MAEKKTTEKKTPEKKAVAKVAKKATAKPAVKATPTPEKVVKQVKKASNYEPKLRIKLKSYDVRMLESSTSKIVSMLTKSGASIK